MSFLKISSTICFLLAPLVFLTGCHPKTIKLKSPPHYDFTRPIPDKLDLKLKEISGIFWDRKRDEFLAHNDEKGILYYLDKETKLIKKEVPFGAKGDYEDVTMYMESPYVLRSDGMLTRIFTDSLGQTHSLDAGKLPITGKNDFETLYYDDNRKALIMVCKNCEMDDKKTVSAFAYYPDSIGFDPKPVFTINADAVRNLAPVKTSKFQPSAAAIHPVLHKLFIISSASNQLVIADLDGNIEAVYVLAKKLFPQPEGITFKNNGDMYISNEGISSKATLLKFLYIQ